MSSCWPLDTWMFLLHPAPELTAQLHKLVTFICSLFPLACDLGTLGVESRVLLRPHACVSCFYQARGEDSLGLLGFSGVWVSLRALCKTKTFIIFRLFHSITLSKHEGFNAPQIWTQSLQRCRRRILCSRTCCPLRSRTPPWRTPPWCGSAETPVTGWQGGCSPGNSADANRS